MACNCYLITEAEFKATISTLNPNLTMLQFGAAFETAHDFDLIPAVGPTCYAELCARRNEEPPTTTPADLALLANIRKFAAWAIYARYLGLNPSLKVDPAGVVMRTGDDYTQAPEGAAETLAGRAAQNAARYKAIFLEWLRANAADYPCLPATPACESNGPAYFGMPSGASTVTDPYRNKHETYTSNPGNQIGISNCTDC